MDYILKRMYIHDTKCIFMIRCGATGLVSVYANKFGSATAELLKHSEATQKKEYNLTNRSIKN